MTDGGFLRPSGWATTDVADSFGQFPGSMTEIAAAIPAEGAKGSGDDQRSDQRRFNAAWYWLSRSR